MTLPTTNATVSDQGNLLKYTKAILLSCLFGVVVSGLCLLIFSVIMSMQDIPPALVNPMAVLALALGSFTAGFASAKILRHRGLLFGAICGVFFFILLMLTSAAVSGQLVGAILFVKFAIILSSSMLGGVFGINTRKKRK